MKIKFQTIILVSVFLFGCLGTDEEGNYFITIHNEIQENIEASYYQCGGAGIKNFKFNMAPALESIHVYTCGSWIDDDFITIKYGDKTKKYLFDPGIWREDDIYVKETDFQ